MKKFKSTIYIFIILMLLFFLVGCWDSKELNTLFVVTGIAIDETEDENEIELTIQVIKNKPSSNESKQNSSPQDNNFIIFKIKTQTIAEGIMLINKDNNHILFLQHNQIILISTAIAKKGIKRFLDFFSRDQDSRLETLVVLVEGKAGDILEANLEQEENSGIFLFEVMKNLSEISKHYRITLLDFISKYSEGTSSASLPLIKLEEDNNKEKITIEGMGFFEEDKLVTTMDYVEVVGYLWFLGDNKHGWAINNSELGTVIYNIGNITSKWEVSVEDSNKVHIHTTVFVTLEIAELYGFDGIDSVGLVETLTNIANADIKENIVNTFLKAQELSLDIYGIGAEIYRYNHKKWVQIKDNWNSLFSDACLHIEVKAKIPSFGQTLEIL